MTDTEILDWLVANTTYLEHGGGMYDFWPQADDEEYFIREDDKVGLLLREYVAARIKEQA